MSFSRIRKEHDRIYVEEAVPSPSDRRNIEASTLSTKTIIPMCKHTVWIGPLARPVRGACRRCLLRDTADIVCCVTQQTGLLCDTADMSAV